MSLSYFCLVISHLVSLQASAARVSDDHRFALLELNEAYVTYMDCRCHTQDRLDSIKDSIKMQSLGAYVNDFCGGEQVRSMTLTTHDLRNS